MKTKTHSQREAARIIAVCGSAQAALDAHYPMSARVRSYVSFAALAEQRAALEA